MTDLVRHCRGASRRLPSRESLTGLGAAWRAAEGALLAHAAANPRRGPAIVARFEALAAACGEREARGRAARLRASVAAMQGRWADADRGYRDALRRLDGVAAASARMGRAGVLVKLGRFADASREASAARRAAARLGEAALAAAATATEALALHEGGSPRKAVPLYARALAAFRAANQPAHVAHCLRNMANAMVLTDRFADAAPLYEEAARTFESLGAARDAALARYNRGALRVSIDRLTEGEADLVAAESALRSAGFAADAAMARIDRGDALLRASLATEALHSIRSGLAMGGRRLAAADRARGAMLAARAWLALDEPAEALRAARTLPDSPHRDELTARALAAGAGGTGASGAVARFERAARRFGRGMPAARARCLAAAGWALLRTSGPSPRAARLIRGAAADADRSGVPSAQFAAHAAAFLHARRAGRRTQAGAALRRATQAFDALSAGRTDDRSAARLADGLDAWVAAAALHVAETDGADAAIDTIDRFRASSLRRAAARAARSAAFGTFASLRENLARLERHAEESALPPRLRTAPVADAPRRIASRVRRAERELAQTLASAAPDGSSPCGTSSLVRRQLDARTAVLSLTPGGRDAAAFLVTARGAWRPDCWAPPAGAPRADVRHAAGRLHFAIGKRVFGDEYFARHRATIDAAVATALDDAAAAFRTECGEFPSSIDRLVVVPSGSWHRIPVAALPWRGGRLIDAFEVSLAPAVSMLADAPHPPAAGRDVVLAFADERAPRIDDEAAAVSASLRGPVVLSGTDARFDRLSDALAGGPPRVLHVAAHGRFRADAPEMSGVRLADGWLRGAEFAGLDLRGSTVVLSGCDTGHGGASGAEVMGLVRGVLAAGAAQAVVSLWKVDDAAAADLMAEFHRGLGSGLPAAAALRAAQARAALQGQSVMDWAAFVSWTARLTVRER